MATTLTRVPRRKVTLRTNLCPDPSVEGDAFGWGHSVAGGAAPLAGKTASASAYVGASVYRVTLTAAPTASPVTIYSAFTPKPGRTISVSARVRVGSALALPASVRLDIEFRDSGDALLSTAAGMATPITSATWELRASEGAVVPVGAVTARAVVAFSTPSQWYKSGVSLDVDAVMVEESPTAGTYFDGDAGELYTWKGSPHASESIFSKYADADITAPIFATGYTAARGARTIVHDRLNASSPAVTLLPLTLRKGALELLYPDAASAHAAVTLFAQLAAFDFLDTSQPLAGMRLVVADGDLEIELEDETRRLWLVRVPFREVTS
ncbi:hypothetical protein [Glaciibacter psychrotolerans]|uniref:Uncharacterized protein n=1 Tax=Glaciibacter psychrotolerans TaxID=670054 RepID=A0A7Z0EFX5_9MICO|nr:hypothetical protein [Leifsonia psychrotolerans]NYJ20805.1 hypothetical protein [Leifsonia psychrotolerans]